MKKLFLFITMVAFVAFTAMAQQQQNIHPRQAQFQAIQKSGGEKQIFHLNILRPTSTDTIGNLQPCDSVFYLWQFSSHDWLSGHNSFIDSAKAERYQGAPGDHITGLWVFFGDATYTNTSTQKCHLRVWDDNGAGTRPGTVLGNVDRTHKSIADDIAAGNLTTVYFTTPLAMPSGGNFYAGVQLDYKLKQGVPTWDSTRSVTLVNSDFIDFNTGALTECGDTTNNTAWEKYSDGTWHSYVESYGFGTRNPVFPIVTTTTGCTIAINPTSAAICKGKSVSLTASGATTYSWAPSTGLNCTSCATVSAKPTATTTYTVTGDAGACSNTVKVTVNATPAVGVTAAPCSGGHVLLTRTGSPTGLTFQWYKNNAVIAGATNSTYSATATAQYKVKVTNTATGCNKTSKNVSVTINCKSDDISITGFDASAYPNPFTKSMTINIKTGSSELANVSLLDYSGRMIRQYNNVDPNSPLEISENLSAGIYFVQVIQGSNQKMLKVVKND